MARRPSPLACVDAAPGLAVSGVRLDGLLAAEIAFPGQGDARAAVACHEAFGRLAHAFAALPTSAELFLVAGKPTAGGAAGLAVLVAGRGDGDEPAARSREGAADVRALLDSSLDFARFVPIADAAEVRRWATLLAPSHAVELTRRVLPLRLEDAGAPEVGFRSGERADPAAPGAATVEWSAPLQPCLDPWHRLADVLARQDQPTGLVIHLAGLGSVEPAALADLRSAAARGARPDLDGACDRAGWPPVDAVRAELLRRVASLESWPTVAARVFVAARAPVPAVVLATVASSLQEPRAQAAEPGVLPRGGCAIRPCAAADVAAPLSRASLATTFSVEEAAALLRTPVPADRAAPGVALIRSRTGAPSRTPARGIALGRNVHRGRSQDVLLDEDSWRLHMAIHGGTGTGKSTLLLRLLLDAARKGRGCVLVDPHGSLGWTLLSLLPPDRWDDVVHVDLGDTAYPVGFNILRIDEADALSYRTVRDQTIDELLAFLERTYDMRSVGGPIFETHFRGMLGLLLGAVPPTPPFFPTLLGLRSLYRSKLLRRRLLERLGGTDLVVEEFVAEAEAVGGESSLQNMAPYVTAKMNRFVNDASLRNVTCQAEALDLDAVLRERKIVIFGLGKGRIGAGAAGLLASQIVARLWRAALRRGPGKHPPFHLVVDEFHLVADERFAELLCEARKYGIVVTLADQVVSALPRPVLQAVLGNVGTIVSLRSGPEDADRLAPLLAPAFSALDIASLPNHRALVRSASAFGAEPFSVDLLPPPRGGSAVVAQGLHEASRCRYGRPRAVVEREVAEMYRAYSEGGRRVEEADVSKAG